MQETKEQVLKAHNEQMKSEFEKGEELEYQKRIAEEEHRNLRKKIDDLEGIPLDIEEPKSYPDFKQTMQELHGATFERKYMRQLYRRYQAKWKKARGG